MDAPAQWTGFDERRLARIGEHLQRKYVEPGLIAGCQVGVVRHGHIAYSRTFGLMDRERGKPVRGDTLWRIYSMTKPLTAVALMMLYERGLFQLDEPVARRVPSWNGQRVWVSGEASAMVTTAAERPVSYRDLLRHTSGLTYGDVLGPRRDGRSMRPTPPQASAAPARTRAWRTSWRRWAASRSPSSRGPPGSIRWRATSAAPWWS